MKLDEYRKEIDRIDKEIIKLLEQRLKTAAAIGNEKAKAGKDIYDPVRESAKLREIKDMAREETRQYIDTAMKEIITQSRKFQEDRKFEYGLLGHPLGHSFSPQVHGAFGRYDFGLYDVEAEELDDFLNKGSFKGITITMPYKKAVIPYCADISYTAHSAGSVNTIVRDEHNKLHGHNTDYHGLKYLIESEGFDIAGAKALVLGNGGVAGTVRKVLEDMGAESVVTVSRKSEENNYENISRHYDADIIVNATPLGMFPENGGKAVDVKMFRQCRGVIDLIYNPLKTELILEAEDAGIKAAGGIKMLVAQAARACELFTADPVSAEETADACNRIIRMAQTISLIGMPGCGKSAVGKELADITEKRFIDLDDYITERTGRTPEQIIREDGEDAFRMVETDLLFAVSKSTGLVIAAGGGIVTREENKHLLRQNGPVVYIKRDLEKLDTAGRPLTEDRGVRTLFDERKDAYESWNDLTYLNDADRPREAALKIAKMLEYH
ncbi:MAG: shikimate kinase [Bacillota bacterium]|nr:shikimate kinase [Bacillota bacterium]